MKSRLVAFLVALNIAALAIHAPDLFSRARAAITEWSTSAASNTSAIGTEGMSEGMNPSAVNDAYREGLAQITRLARQAVLSSFGPSTYTVSAYYITPALVPAAAISGQTFSFVPASTNIGSATLRVGSIAAKTIVKLSNSTLANGDLQAGTAAVVVDGGTYYHLLNPQNSLVANSITLSNIATGVTGSLITFGTDQAATFITAGETGKFLKSRGISSTAIWDTLTAVSAATQSELEATTSTSVYTAPGTQQYHPSAAKAWVRFDGTASTLIGPAYNATASKVTTGSYTVTFTTAFSTTSYMAIPLGIGGAESYRSPVYWTTGFHIETHDSGGGNQDYTSINIVFYGDQ